MVGAQERREVKGNFSIGACRCNAPNASKRGEHYSFQNRRALVRFNNVKLAAMLRDAQGDISLTYCASNQLKCHYCVSSTARDEVFFLWWYSVLHMVLVQSKLQKKHRNSFQKQELNEWI